MTERMRKPTSASDLAKEARNWDTGALSPRDWHDAPDAIPNVGRSTPISLRVPTQMLTLLKEFARREGIGYQVLMKRWLDDRIRVERGRLAEQQSERNSDDGEATNRTSHRQ